MQFLPDIPLLHWLFWIPVLGFWSNSGGDASTTNNYTATSSGQNSPNAIGDSQAIGSGSIGVAGQGAKYLESGAVDASGAQIGGVGGSVNASSGSVINIGDPQATQTIAALAQNFADTVQTMGSGGGGSTVVTTPSGSGGGFSLTTLGVFALIGFGLLFLFGLFKGARKA